MRIRIKICGLTRPEDARAAAMLGTDAIGLVFAPGSPRYLRVEDAAAVCRLLPPFVSRVGVFQDAEAETVSAILARLPLDLLQFHGSEAGEVCAHFGRPWLKAVPMAGGGSVMQYMRRYPGAAGFLLDAHGPGESGGMGAAFDWKTVPERATAPVILAGGLKPENVYEAIETVRPYGVDVSSGVESEPGIKNMDKMREFIAEVRRAEAAVIA